MVNISDPGLFTNLSGAISKKEWNSLFKYIAVKKRIIENQTLDKTAFTWFCNTDSGSYSIDLPAINGTYMFRIINTGSSGNNLTINPDGSETIRGSSSLVLTDGQDAFLSDDSTDGWW